MSIENKNRVKKLDNGGTAMKLCRVLRLATFIDFASL